MRHLGLVVMFEKGGAAKIGAINSFPLASGAILPFLMFTFAPMIAIDDASSWET